MVKVLARVYARHPDLSEEDVLTAWDNRLRTQFRLDGEKPYMVGVGVARSGKPLEMIAFDDQGDTVIFHAMTPPTKKLLKEMGMLS